VKGKSPKRRIFLESSKLINLSLRGTAHIPFRENFGGGRKGQKEKHYKRRRKLAEMREEKTEVASRQRGVV